MKVNLKSILMLALIVVVVLVAVTTISDNFSEKDDPTYYEILDYFDEDRVKSFVINGDMVIKLQVIREGDNPDKLTETVTYKLTDTSQKNQIYNFP